MGFFAFLYGGVLAGNGDKGASIYDVRTEVGWGVPSKADIVSNLRKGVCVNLRTGEGGQKIRKFADIIYGSPLRQRETERKEETWACERFQVLFG